MALHHGALGCRPVVYRMALQTVRRANWRTLHVKLVEGGEKTRIFVHPLS
ncbi:hypothetical protein ACVIW0_007248 [Bradyrhizobium sp. USDA 4454]